MTKFVGKQSDVAKFIVFPGLDGSRRVGGFDQAVAIIIFEQCGVSVGVRRDDKDPLSDGRAPVFATAA